MALTWTTNLISGDPYFNPMHLFHLGATPPQTIRTGGSRIDATSTEFPVLNGMSLSLLTLQPKGFREPHWHPNANELSYCLEGKGLMTILGPGSDHETLVIEPGSIVFVPQGSIHHIENLGDSPLKMLICFNHASPEDLDISVSVKGIPSNALAATLKMKPQFFEGLKSSLKEDFIGMQTQPSAATLSMATNRYKLDLEATLPFVENSGGWVKISNPFILSPLQGLAIYSLQLNGKGVREPHWHPNAHELNYLMEGRVKINLVSPGETVESFEMVPGDISFMPRGYLHHIENIGQDPVRMAIFFNHESPSDIGISNCYGGYSNRLFASLYGTSPEVFDGMLKSQHDLFVVPGKQ